MWFHHTMVAKIEAVRKTELPDMLETLFQLAAEDKDAETAPWIPLWQLQIAWLNEVQFEYTSSHEQA